MAGGQENTMKSICITEDAICQTGQSEEKEKKHLLV